MGDRPPVTFEQAVFTSIPSPMGQGYRLVAASPGVKAEEKVEITQRSPSHGSLCGQDANAKAIMSYRLTTGRHAVAYCCHSGREHTARGGWRVYTQIAILDESSFLGCDCNPFCVWRAIDEVVSRQGPLLKAVSRLEPLTVSPDDDLIKAQSTNDGSSITEGPDPRSANRILNHEGTNTQGHNKEELKGGQGSSPIHSPCGPGLAGKPFQAPDRSHSSYHHLFCVNHLSQGSPGFSQFDLGYRLSQHCDSHGRCLPDQDIWLWTAVSGMLGGQSMILAGIEEPIVWLERALLFLPRGIRGRLSLSAGLAYSPGRKIMMTLIADADPQIRRLITGRNIAFYETAAEPPILPATLMPWLALMARWCREGRWPDIRKVTCENHPNAAAADLASIAMACEECDRKQTEASNTTPSLTATMQ